MWFFFSDCETETIYTSQSRDTVSTEDEDDDDDDDDGNEFDDDMVAEYEPTSGAETERPPQVTTRHTQLQYKYKGWTHKYSFSILNLIISLHEICKDW